MKQMIASEGLIIKVLTQLDLGVLALQYRFRLMAMYL